MNWKQLAIAAVSATTIASAAHAQRSVHFGVGGGAAIPIGKFHEKSATGKSVLGAIVWGGESSIIGLRLDYSAMRFAGRNTGGVIYPKTSAVAVTGSIVGTLPLGSIKPYVLAGGGWYPYREATDDRRDNDFGVAGGGGVTFPFVLGAGFFEVRAHSVSGRQTTNNFVVATFGLLL